MKRSKARKDVNKGVDNHNNSNPARKAALEAAKIAQERNEDKIAIRLDHRTVVYLDRKDQILEIFPAIQFCDLCGQRMTHVRPGKYQCDSLTCQVIPDTPNQKH